jgi:hypothetical protein
VALIRILSTRRAIAVVALAAMTAACRSRSASIIERHGHAEGPSLPAVDVRVLLQPEHQRESDRFVRAAVATLTTGSEWLGAFPGRSLTVIDPPFHSAAAIPAGAVLVNRVPWWTTGGSMAPELSVARAVGARFWRERVDSSALPPWWVDAIVEYMARRAVTPLFEGDNLAPGYAFLEERYFGGFVPRFVRIRLFAATDGAWPSAYRRNPTVAIVDRPGSALAAESLAGKALLTLGTLERWLGRPVFDEAIAEFVRRTTRPSLADFARAVNAVSAQDLSWLFEQAYGSSAIFDYGIASLTSRPDAGVFTTTVVARRFGEAQFTGASEAPIGPFESGQGIVVRVTFEDGQQRTDRWDGRARERTFRYRSPARAISAVVDPERVLLLDTRQSNNSLTLVPRSGAVASHWARLWMVWLQHFLLTYGCLV